MPISNRARALYVEIGRRIAQRRRALPGTVTQSDLAASTSGELTRSAVANIETGRHRVSVHQLFVLAEALDCAPNELLPDQPMSMAKVTLPRGAQEGDDAALDLMNRLGQGPETQLPTNGRPADAD